MLLVIADSGSVDVSLVTSSGRARAWRTRGRMLTWPAGWGPLAVGERGTVTVRSCGRTDVARFERAPPLAPDLRWRSAELGAPWLLERGLPMEALLLLATDPRPAPLLRSRALLGAGTPVLGLWLHR